MMMKIAILFFIRQINSIITSYYITGDFFESKNKRLEDTIEEFKSRKVVKFADKIRR